MRVLNLIYLIIHVGINILNIRYVYMFSVILTSCWILSEASINRHDTFRKKDLSSRKIAIDGDSKQKLVCATPCWPCVYLKACQCRCIKKYLRDSREQFILLMTIVIRVISARRFATNLNRTAYFTDYRKVRCTRVNLSAFM